MATVFRLPAQEGMVNPVAPLGAASVSGPTASAESPLTTNNEKEDNPRVQMLMKTRLLLLLVGFFALESACLARGSKPGKSAPSPGPTTTAIRHECFFNEMRGPRLPERATDVADLFSAESR